MVAVSIGGCSPGRSIGSPASPAIGVLQDVADVLRVNSTPKPPAKLGDLKAGRTLSPRGYESIKSGDVVVVWGLPIAAEGDVESGTAPKRIIAYEKKTPADGGYVLRQNGQVESLTSDQFKAEDKAK